MPRSTPPRLTRRALLRLGGGTLGLAGLGFLAACGTTPTPQAVGLAPSTTAVPPTVTAAPQASAPPSASVTTAPTPQTAAATSRAAAVTATPQSTATPPPVVTPTTAAVAPPAVAATMTLPLFNGLPQGRTADGFPFLGNPDAAVTLIDYSDFL